MTLPQLIERLEKLTGPDREYDAQIALTLEPESIVTADGDMEINPMWHCDAGKIDLPRFTGSVDAALTLVPEGWAKDIAICPEMGAAVRVYPGPVREDSAGEATAHARTPEIALCAAALKAKLRHLSLSGEA